MAKEKNKKIEMGIDIALYVISCLFLLTVMFVIGRWLVFILSEHMIVKYYLCGFLGIAAVIMSVVNVDNFHKKYFKNDSDSSKRQNDLFFESDILREEERYTNR